MKAFFNTITAFIYAGLLISIIKLAAPMIRKKRIMKRDMFLCSFFSCFLLLTPGLTNTCFILLRFSEPL